MTRARIVWGVVIGVIVVVAVVGVVAAVRGASAPSLPIARPSASPTPSVPEPEPTPPSVLWAGRFCEDRDAVSAAVGQLGRNLSYDVGADASALDQINAQLSAQATAVSDALVKLTTTLGAVPVDFTAANELATSAMKAKQDTTEAIDATRQHLDAMVNAGNVVTGAAEAAQAVTSGKAAYEAGSTLVGLLADAASGKNDELQAAFDAAPQCRAAAGSPSAG